MFEQHCAELMHVAFAGEHPDVPQRPALHRPEQHWPCEVHCSFAARQLPRQVLSWHCAPGQQSVGC